MGVRILPIAECLAKEKAQGITRIELEVSADNTAAIHLYKKFGFVQEALKRRAMRFDGTYFDALLISLVHGNGI